MAKWLMAATLAFVVALTSTTQAGGLLEKYTKGSAACDQCGSLEPSCDGSCDSMLPRMMTEPQAVFQPGQGNLMLPQPPAYSSQPVGESVSGIPQQFVPNQGQAMPDGLPSVAQTLPGTPLPSQPSTAPSTVPGYGPSSGGVSVPSQQGLPTPMPSEIFGGGSQNSAGAFQASPLPSPQISESTANQFAAAINSRRRRSASDGFAASAADSPPNIIGDLFNAGTSSLNFNARIEAVPFDSTSFTGALTSVPSVADLTNGVTTSFDGFTVRALDPVGDVIQIGDTTTLDLSELSPISSIELRSLADSASLSTLSIGGVQVFGLAEPTDKSLIYQAANRALNTEFSSELTGDVDVEDIVDVEFLGDESSLEVSSSFGELVARYVYQLSTKIPVPSPGEVIGRYSISDNNSPLPRDRLFLDYNFFHNARISAVGIPVNRWSPGFEKTFLGGNASLELRAPMAITLSSRVETNGDDLLAYEFGDIAMALKVLLYRNRSFAWSAGMAMTLPTADDFELVLLDGTTAARINNETVRLQPYTGFLIQPTQSTFIQSFAQLDVDTNGNPVFLDELAFRSGGFSSDGLQRAGRLKSQTLLRWNTSMGVMWQRAGARRTGRCRLSNCSCCSGLKINKLAGVFETHYTATLNRSDTVGSENFSVGDPNRTLNVLNLTAGLHAYMGPRTVTTVGYGVPVTSDRVFDGELRVFMNRYF